MNLNLTLIKREWLQHRFSWALLAVIPLILVALLSMYGDIELNVDDAAQGIPPALTVVAGALAVGVGLMLLLSTVAGLITVVGLARRDHADRSVEFWLSLPIGHLRSLLLPVVVHLLLVPLAASLVGLVVGLVAGALVVHRLHGFGAWLALPWFDLAGGVIVGWLRLLAGWPLMLLWFSPLLAIAMLMFAWMRRWGLVVLGLVLAVGASPLGEILGYRLLPNALGAMTQGAASALISGRAGLTIENDNNAGQQLLNHLPQAPLWLLQDVAGSLRQLASPTFVLGLAVAALCLAGLVAWRKRGASTAV